MEIIRVLILSDDPLSRAGLVSILTEDKSLNVVAQAGMDRFNQALIDVFTPDIILVESHAPPDDNFLTFNMPVVVLSGLKDDLARRGYGLNIIPRDSELAMISAALHAVAIGLDIQPATAHKPNHFKENYDALLEALTRREGEVMQLIAQGLTNRAIGQVLKIQESTVKYHVNRILEKLGAQSRTEAVIIASRNGLITL
jgi:DNA-binding NarL/FixJ family response regulator